MPSGKAPINPSLPGPINSGRANKILMLLLILINVSRTHKKDHLQTYLGLSFLVLFSPI